MDKIFICTACPKGCPIRLIPSDKESSGYTISGHLCRRGESFVLAEMTDPVRILTTTLSVDKSNSQRLPVRSDKGIPKTKLLDCMKELKSIRVSKSVQIGQIIVENILDTGVNIIASRSLWIQPREGDNG